MKKSIIGAIVLIAALAMTGCNNDKKEKRQKEDKTEAKAERLQLPNRLLIIVDPQVDFTTGSLATAKGPAAMDYLAKALNEGAWKNYGWIIATQDAHPKNHCSFVEQGGVFLEAGHSYEMLPAIIKYNDGNNYILDRLTHHSSTIWTI